jgi:F0F1-type ATP synthase delta subunit
MPAVIKLLRENKNIIFIKSIFKYFEEVSYFGDEYLVNIFSITALDKLGDDKEILKIAKQYMGTRTTQLQMEADRDLGRI